MIWSALIIEKPGSCAITALPPAADEVLDEPDPAAVVEPVVSVVLPAVPESAVVDDEPAVEPEVPASAVVDDDDVSDEPVVLPAASAVVEEEPEPVVVFIALEAPDAACRPPR